MKIKLGMGSTAAKVIVLIIAGLLVQGVCSLAFFIFSYANLASEQSRDFRTQTFQERQHELMNLVHLAYDVIRSYHDRATDVDSLKQAKEEELQKIVDGVTSQAQAYYRQHGDELSREELEQAIMDLVRGVRFDNGNYLWINDMHPRMVMHPVKPELDGADLSEYQDPAGTFLFNEMVSVCEADGAGVVDYLWSKPGEEEPKPKISYVRLLPELGWIIGSGAWIEDITADMQAQALAQIAHMRLSSGNYFWINDDTEPVPYMVMHPTVPSLDGQLLDDPKFEVATSMQKGEEGTMEPLDKANLFSAFVQVCRAENDGFVVYQWPKPLEGGGVTTDTYPKLSYVERFEPWGWIVGMGVYIDEIDDMVAAFEDRVRRSVLQNVLWGSLMALVVLCLAVGVSLVVVRRSLTRPLGSFNGYLDTIGSGDLSAELGEKFTGEMGQLQDHLEQMVVTLRRKDAEAARLLKSSEEEAARATQARQEAEEARAQAVQARREGMLEAARSLEGIVMELSGAGEQLHDRVHEVTQAMETQADRTGHTAAAMEEMNATALAVARNAGEVSESASATGEIAAKGETVVQESVQAMEEVRAMTDHLKADMDSLSGRVEAIGQVMSVINDIADQTNLLALNAAIEAARAGDAGRGFAVVADEVRKLAEKTMNATKEVEEAVTGVQEDTLRNQGNMDRAAAAVGKATSQVESSGQSLAAILERVRAVSDQVDSIATAAEEQSATSDEISHNVEDISRIASETNQGMQDAARAIENLNRLSEQLAEIVQSLRTEE